MAVLIPASHMHPHSFPTRRSSDLSLGLYTKDAFVPATWPANQWSLRIDAARIVPVLERLGDNRGLRIAAGRLHRAARDLRRWIGVLENAEAIEAADSVSGGVEELRVRIASK